MGKFSPDPDAMDQRLAEAKVVYEAHPDDIGMLEYIRAAKQ